MKSEFVKELATIGEYIVQLTLEEDLNKENTLNLCTLLDEFIEKYDPEKK